MVFGLFRKKEEKVIQIDQNIIKHTKEHQNCMRELERVDIEIVKRKREVERERDYKKKATAMRKLGDLVEKRKRLMQRIVVLTRKMGQDMRQDVQHLRRM